VVDPGTGRTPGGPGDVRRRSADSSCAAGLADDGHLFSCDDHDRPAHRRRPVLPCRLRRHDRRPAVTERLDPLAAAADIESGYKRYLKTLIAPREPRLATAFDTSIDDATSLAKGPLLELTPPYEPGATLSELVAEGVLHERFGDLGAGVAMDR